MRIETFMDEVRERKLALCVAMGIDPARVLDIEWRADSPKVARVTIFDGPMPEHRHIEEHLIPEEWRA